MRIAAIFWASQAFMLGQAVKDVESVELELYTSRSLDADPEIMERAKQSLRNSDAIVLYRSSELFWAELEPILREEAQKKPVLHLSHDPSLWSESNLALPLVRRAYDYVALGGRENFANLLRYAASLAKGQDGEGVDFPQPEPWEGYYHPGAPQKHYLTKQDFATWHAGYLQEKGLESAPRVGMLFSRHYFVNANHGVEDALIAALETEGLAVIPVFSHGVKDANVGNKGSLQTVREAFLEPEGSSIEALVKLTTFFLGQEKGREDDESQAGAGVELFKQLNVPVFQPVCTNSQTIDEWQANPLGLSQEIPWMVAMPEFEGVIEPFFIGGVERDGEASELDCRAAHPERCKRLARRVKRWIALRQTPAAKRKVAFILNNNPCASVEATVGGAAKLDSLQSVANVLKAMAEAGYCVDVPKDGRELIETIMERKAISEFRWTTVDEIVKKGGTLDLLPLETYAKWWESFPEAMRERIRQSWGEPPGEHLHGVPPSMVYEGKIVISGVNYGNAVVLVQPKRGCAGTRCDGQVCKILHDPDIPPPHQYIATYRWLSDVYGAHAIVHVGTHGNLEFLPGKGVGLSESCLPDLCLHETPHLYIYNSDNPPEGTIAKRRSYAVLVDHMQTALSHSGLYESLEELDNLLTQYEQANIADNSRAHALEHLILGAIRKANLEDELGIKPDISDHDQDYPAIIRKTHEVLSRYRNTFFDNGMHVFGEIPQGERRADLIYSILRHDGGETHTLRKTLCRAMGTELIELLNEQGAIDQTSGLSHGQLIEKVDAVGKALIWQTLENPEASRNGAFKALAAELLGDLLRDASHLSRLDPIRAKALDISRRIEESKEIESLLNGFSGGHIPAGPSGVLTRGRNDILPTGRNFYSLDPRRVPTKAAAMVGRSLAQALIDKHLSEECRYPENVAVFWMANDIMWADGEGMAQILDLLGTRPVWSSDGRVHAIEVVPLSELGRPRIDVTIRVSGLIRDNFADRMELVDEAVRQVAALDEPEEENFMRKHTLEKLREQGKSVKDAEALRRASLRLFGSKPGTYQPGVNLAIYASAWKTEEDLSDIFLHWNGYAYGKGVAGEIARTELESSLKSVEITYNKVVSDEHDLFGCCGYFGTHGGLSAAAGHLSGKKVKNYYGDTREPEHVEVRDLADEVRRVARAKLLHPAWIEGMKRHGYKGAGDISKRVGRVYGFEATTGDVDNWIFDDIAKTFVLNEENRAFFEEHNPWALEEIGRRLLEAANRGLWQADPEVLEGLKEHILEIEGWLEERMGEVSGEFQGGRVDVLTASDVERWQNALNEFKAADQKK